ncbi:peptide receptor GPCR [Elysia marginata]|uniref:Peptide receptor GPCR n=1 Tax=Elysia marginata TaxID=1093978 RepID=A0AAV4J094_9GAST|nr:peptide receptor GPCR [Elysia marginata]
MALHNRTHLHIVFDPEIQLSPSAGDVAMYYIGLILKMYVNPLLGLGGIVINIINTFIFYKMGLSDGVTQNFLILSIFDGILAAAALVNSLSYILMNTIYTRGGPVAENLQAVFWASVVSWPFSQIVSCITTTVIAVVRCCCVAMPLRVKQVLTARRQLAAIAAFSLGVDSVLVYVFEPTHLVRFTNPSTNISQVAYEGARYDLLNIFTNIFLYITFVIVILCLIILIISLNRSSKFRDQSSKVSGANEKKGEKSREVRVVQTVILVAAIFIIFNTPTIVLSIVRQVTPGFSVRGHLRELYDFFIIFMETSLLLNVVANIFVYVGFNTRYRNILLESIGRSRSDAKLLKA